MKNKKKLIDPLFVCFVFLRKTVYVEENLCRWYSLHVEVLDVTIYFLVRQSHVVS